MDHISAKQSKIKLSQFWNFLSDIFLELNHDAGKMVFVLFVSLMLSLWVFILDYKLISSSHRSAEHTYTSVVSLPAAPVFASPPVFC